MSELDRIAQAEVSLALTQTLSLGRIGDLGPSPLLFQCMQRLGCSVDQLNEPALDWKVSRIHLGNEFCERLLPTRKELKKALLLAAELGFRLTLVTPMLTDLGLKQLDNLLPSLPDDTEVVINDWGVLQRLQADYSSLRPLLGRMLNKMIKDPRLPTEQWTKLHPHNSQSAHFQSFLGRFRINQLEMDVPPFARVEQFQTAPMELGVHLPYGYVVKGRMCRIGSLNQKDDGKFVAAHACHKECLTYWVKAERPGVISDSELHSFQRGNTQFYRHSASMAQALWQAVDRGWIRRLIFAGDWHENHRPDQQG